MKDMDLIDVSDNHVKKKKHFQDKFMLFIYILLVLLVILGSTIYFFGYEFFKPYIRV